MSTASAAETVGGKIACITKAWYDDFVKFAAADDLESIEVYMEQKRCFQLKDGMTVTIMEYPGMLGGVWEVAYRGQKFYVQREGIRDY
ncbi:hypothetical protein ACJO2E_08670 [Marinobacter sp. M1N3S26]|uniref:hypothetical protein n=1 Tax=Marinobacter sp. M1N3S26 TaxID=3382299 RepID=UPI00387B2C12